MYFKSFIAGVAFAAISAVSAGAATVTNGGSYDINSDTNFGGTVFLEVDGGPGHFIAEFYSTVDPSYGEVQASLTVARLSAFEGLKVSWIDSQGAMIGTVLDTALASEDIMLSTTFTTPHLEQYLKFEWTNSTVGQGFDFDVSAVPLPAGGLLLLTALGGLGFARRRKQAA